MPHTLTSHGTWRAAILRLVRLRRAVGTICPPGRVIAVHERGISRLRPTGRLMRRMRRGRHVVRKSGEILRPWGLLALGEGGWNDGALKSYRSRLPVCGSGSSSRWDCLTLLVVLI